ncbi:SEFIR domain protein [Caulifigura coniformis]|uniref:SEFIR domain protein n=1 Tax=Caulifigura coniformis TaxID=2527983 RepID=A0A517SBV3_9PLAN|nr:toll/interleukin-1 receptor domain-containing protein [Caulifigura coniformis]QDT53608.1 SEFIR domain protein [Caulifigura coniformis]
MSQDQDVPAAATEAPNGPPTVFISYTHESPEHKRWAAQLAVDLRKNGINAEIDQWATTLGSELTLFMEQGITKADRVLLICTPTYAQKANEGQGGVGYERLVITSEIAKQIATDKFVCALRAGDGDSVPIFARTRRYVDFRDDSSYRTSLEELARDILKAPALVKPAIGPNPFLTESPIRIADGPALVSVSASANIEDVFARAEQLLRVNDLLGWKRLQQNTRRDVFASLLQWSTDADKRCESDEELFTRLKNACVRAAPLMLLGMLGIASEKDRLTDQRGLLFDFVEIPGWKGAGTVWVIESPQTLAFIYSHFAGAMLTADGHRASALRLLHTKVPAEAGSTFYQEVYASPQLMGWVKSLDNHLAESWTLLFALWEEQSWLTHFFPDVERFKLALSGYSLLATLADMAAFIKSGKTEIDRYNHTAPPTFLMDVMRGKGSMTRIISSVLPDAEAVSELCRELGVEEAAFRSLWPSWIERSIARQASIFRPTSSLIAMSKNLPQLP